MHSPIGTAHPRRADSVHTVHVSQDRPSAHCFFQPTSRCGERAVQIFAEPDVSAPAPLARSYGRYGRNSGNDIPHLRAQVVSACRRAAAQLGVNATEGHTPCTLSTPCTYILPSVHC